jgi:hypothetical protein
MIFNQSSIFDVLVLASTRYNGSSPFSTYMWNHI